MEVPVRVVARVKPSTYEDEESCMQVAPAASQIVLGCSNFYDFDAVFGEEISQNDLYNSCLADIISNFFQGFKTTVINYGQEGSGKTYTMIGPDFLRAMSEEEFGLLPQAVRHIFKIMNEHPEREYRVHISYLIIHQESIYDLLATTLVPLNVLEDSLGNVVIPGMTVVDCNSISEVFNCLETGLLQRHSASSQGLNFSSAHTIFNFTLEHQWTETDGKLNYIYSYCFFIDLSGSEETMPLEYREMGGLPIKNNFLFNSDLKSLVNIICSLANKNHMPILPYRVSKLTHILKDSFGGNNLTLLICCLSPSAKDYEASHNTLKVGTLSRYVMNFPAPSSINQSTVQSMTPLSNSNGINVWNSFPSTHTGNPSITPLFNGTAVWATATPLPHLSHGLPPNLQVIQAPLMTSPCEVKMMNPPKEDNSVRPQKSEEIFRVEFAASQWHLLVSSAEDLLAEILQGGSVSPTEKTRIESWLCMKAEADDCIGADIPQLQTHISLNRPLEVIEELSEPNELSESIESESPSNESEVSSSVSSLGEEFYDQLETLKEKFLSLTSDMIRHVEEQYDSSEKLCEKFPPTEKPHTHTHVQENIATSSLQSSSESLREHVESMVVSTSSSCSSPTGIVKDKMENLCEKDKENLHINFGSHLSLLSKESASPPPLKRESKSQKRRRKMIDKLKRISIRGKQHLPISPASSPEAPHSENGNFISEDDLQNSSENELLQRVSSKFVSVSKGSSKCVNNIKSKSSQLKRSIRSHIFKRRNKTNQVSAEMEVPPKLHSSELKPCSVRLVSDELRVAEQRLQELKATISVKEAFIVELKRSGSEAAATRKKCQGQIEHLHVELSNVKQCYHKAQNKMRDASHDEDEKNHYRSKVDAYSHQISQIQKRLTTLQKVSSISQQNDSKVKELEMSIRDLRQQQEELHTKFREEMQRKQQLEQQILREERCARNPLCTSKLLDEDSDKDYEMDDVPSACVDIGCVTLEEEKAKRSLVEHSKKRKLINSTGDSQSETQGSLKGGDLRARRDRHKLGRIDRESLEEFFPASVKGIDAEVAVENCLTTFTRKEIDILRVAKEGLINKRQKLDKRIRKGRTQGDGREEERKLIELDEAVEGFDAIIELKNGIISGRVTHFEPYFHILAKHDLEDNLRKLPLEELHFLLIKYFDRLIDLRIEFRKQELAYAELENQFDEQNRYISNLKATYQQASLEMERRLTSLQREYQYKISYLLRQFNDDSSGYGVHELKYLEMEQQAYYYKKLSRELKEKLKQYLNQGNSFRYSEPEPGPSGVKSRSHGPTAVNFYQSQPRSSLSSSTALPSWPRRGRRFALHSNNVQTKVTREKNKLIIQQKGEKHGS